MVQVDFQQMGRAMQKAPTFGVGIPYGRCLVRRRQKLDGGDQPSLIDITHGNAELRHFRGKVRPQP